MLGFLESIGALTLIGGALYFYLKRVDQVDHETKFYMWILEHDYKVRKEFEEKHSMYNPDYKTLKEFFTEEKLAEINTRWEEEGTPT